MPAHCQFETLGTWGSGSAAEGQGPAGIEVWILQGMTKKTRGYSEVRDDNKKKEQNGRQEETDFQFFFHLN